MLRGALAALLDLEPDITVVAQAANGHKALQLVRQHTPDVVITDIEMPERSGLELADDLKHTASSSHVIVLTIFLRVPGICAELSKPAHAGTFSRTGLPANSQRPCASSIDPDLAAEAWSGDQDPLSDRERQIVYRAGEGRSTAEIAADLRLSEGTVRNYLSEAIAKLGAANRIHAARIARGWF